tara:strand:+ start:531 stop:650 length:120 start_codon:yes stop_codon:yes gene_type:complete
MDLAGEHLSILKYLEQNPTGILNLNLGTGKGRNIIELKT